jgi:uncharacterized delta-60 repeat protein
VVQADGKILAAGDFTTLGGGGTGTTTRNYVGRLNADGNLDTSFDPGANEPVYALAVQADGKILVGGNFTTLGGGGTGTTTRNYIGRLDADGSLDTSFNPGANDTVMALAVQTDGRILVGGGFTTLGGGGTGTTTRNLIGRLTNTDAAIQNLTVIIYGATITWERSGASPEVGRVTCELSTDGTTYAALGSATRIAGGWQLTGLSLPKAQNIFIRARGFYSSGWSNSSGSIVESVRAVFLPQEPPACYTFSTSASPSVGGLVAVNTASNCTGGYTSGTAISLTATPATNYVFINWTPSGSLLRARPLGTAA